MVHAAQRDIARMSRIGSVRSQTRGVSSPQHEALPCQANRWWTVCRRIRSAQQHHVSTPRMHKVLAEQRGSTAMPHAGNDDRSTAYVVIFGSMRRYLG